MKRAEAEKLLGGYATGTLTEAERKLLFEAALEDQELFEALADEEALRELLSDPRVRRRLLAALAEREAGLWERLWAWWRRPVAWGVAGSVAVAALLVVMLLPVVRTAPAGRHAAEGQGEEAEAAPVAQPPAEVAKKELPAAAAVARRVRAALPAAVRGPAERAEAKQAVEAELAAKPKQELAAAQVEEPARTVVAAPTAPSQELAKGGAVGGVVGGLVSATPRRVAVEADARALYYWLAAESRDVAQSAFRAKRVLAEAPVPRGVAPTGLRYVLLRSGSGGAYEEVAADTTFTVGDQIRLSVEANRSGVIRLTRRDAAGVWNTVAELRVEARARQIIPAAGLRLDASETLALELTRGAGLAATGKPVLHRAAEERAVYVVDPAGGAALRTEIHLAVR